MQNYSVFFTSQFNFIACGCQTPGSTSNTCSNDGKCTCNIGYEGDKCSECASEYFKTQAGCSGTIFVMVYLYYVFEQAACRFLHVSQNFRFSLLLPFWKYTGNYSALFLRTLANGYF